MLVGHIDHFLDSLKMVISSSSRVFKFYGLFSAKNITSNGAKSLGNSEFQIQPPELDESEFKADRLSVIVNVQLFRISKP